VSVPPHSGTTTVHAEPALASQVVKVMRSWFFPGPRVIVPIGVGTLLALHHPANGESFQKPDKKQATIVLCVPGGDPRHPAASRACVLLAQVSQFIFSQEYPMPLTAQEQLQEIKKDIEGLKELKAHQAAVAKVGKMLDDGLTKAKDLAAATKRAGD
jgi:hypothetical protein